MRNHIHFWIATLIRGVIALLFGSAVVIIPDMAATLLLLPFAIVISILCLAAYGVIDSTIVIATSYMTASRRVKVALRVQGILGIVIGIVLLSIPFDHVKLPWFLYLIGAQALCIAAAEFTVARHALTESICVWNYAIATVAVVCGVLYIVTAAFFVDTLMPREIAWLLFGYLLAFGIAQCLTAARMLYPAAHAGAPSNSLNG